MWWKQWQSVSCDLQEERPIKVVQSHNVQGMSSTVMVPKLVWDYAVEDDLNGLIDTTNFNKMYLLFYGSSLENSKITCFTMEQSYGGWSLGKFSYETCEWG